MRGNEAHLELVKDEARMWPPELVALYRQQYAPLVRLAYGMLGRRTEAEAVVQDAVLRLRDWWAARSG